MVFKAKAALDFLLGVAAGTRKFIHSFQDGCFAFLSITFSPSLSPSFCFKAFFFICSLFILLPGRRNCAIQEQERMGNG